MQRAYATLAAACIGTGAAVVYAHWKQEDDRNRMHQGVLRDIEREKVEAVVVPAAAGAGDDPNCESGICDLKVVRQRDPVTGQVYAGPSVAEGQRAAAVQALAAAAVAQQPR